MPMHCNRNLYQKSLNTTVRAHSPVDEGHTASSPSRAVLPSAPQIIRGEILQWYNEVGLRDERATPH